MKKIIARITTLLFLITALFTLSGCEGLWEGIESFFNEAEATIESKAVVAKNTIASVAKKVGSSSKEIFDNSIDFIVDTYGTAKDGVVYAFDSTVEFTQKGLEKAGEKSKELIGNVEDFIFGIDNEPDEIITYANCDSEKPIKDLPSNYEFNQKNSFVINSNYETEQFIAYYISSILSARGYSVYNGAAYYKNKLYGGLIYTKKEIFVEEDNQKIYSCGFVQLISEDYDGLLIDDDIVNSGLIAVPCDSTSEADAYIVDEFSLFDDFSGLYNNVKFSYEQIDNYVIKVKFDQSIKSYYDFDNEKSINYVDNNTSDSLYFNNNEEYMMAKETINAIKDYEENNDGYISTVLVYDGSTMDSIDYSSNEAAKNNTKKFGNNLNNKEIDNAFLKLNETGDADIYEASGNVDEARLTNGLLTTIGTGLATAGVVASVICTCTAGSVVVSAIVITTGTSAIIYNVSNMIEGVQDIYYGSKGSNTESSNPILNLFKAYIPDKDMASMIYHIWGISNNVISSLMVPVAKALTLAKVSGLNAFHTTISVLRASLTTVAKALATTVGAGLVGNYVSKVVAKATKNDNMGKIAGFGAGLVTGMLIYKGLDAIDKKLNVSGLYPKNTIKQSFIESKNQQTESYFSTEVDSNNRGEIQKEVDFIVDCAVEEYGIENRPSVKIVYDSNAPYDGYYSNYENEICVNALSSENQTLEGLLDTIGHEMRHAAQWQSGDENMLYSLEHYIRPEQNYSDYRYQLCEADAFEAGAKFSSKMMDFFSLLGLI